MAAQQVGTVASTKGEVFARNAQGQTRRLSAGDKIMEGDVIITAAGSTAQITPTNGPVLNVAEQQTVSVDGTVVSSQTDPTAGGVSPAAATTAATVLDANALLEEEAAAAGLTGGGAEGGHSFVNLMRIAEGTQGVGYDFPTNPGGVGPQLTGDALNGLPTAGDLTIELDEDDISYGKGEDGSDVRYAGWVGEFEDSLGVDAAGNYWWGNNDQAPGDDVPTDSSTTMVGKLNFSFGPDGAGNIKFNLPTAATTAPLTSGGEEVQYWVSADGHTIVGYVFDNEFDGKIRPNFDGGEDGPLVPQAKVIFSGTVTDVETGEFSFTLWGPVDHPDTTTEDNLVLPLSFTVTDRSGDSVTGTLRVNIDDDSPAYRGGEDGGEDGGNDGDGQIYATIEEESVPTGEDGVIGNNEEDGLRHTTDVSQTYTYTNWYPAGGWQWVETGGGEDGETDGYWQPVGEWLSSTYTYTYTWQQSIQGLADWGADGFDGVKEVTVEGLTLPLAEGSVVFQFDADGHVIPPQADTEGAAYLVVNADGSYTFSVTGAMNHTGAGEDMLQIPPIAITATDGDGDPITFTLNVEVQDDVPVLSGESINESVSEADIGTRFSTGTDAGEGPAVVSGDLSELVSFGADGEGSFGFNTAALQTLYSTEFWGPLPVPVKLTYSIVNDTINHTTTLVATEPDTIPGPYNSGNVVFELQLNTTNGAYEFRLHDELRHLFNSDDSITLNFGAIIDAKDGDNDPVTLGQSFSINVDDDVPAPQIGLTDTTVQHDETPGVNGQPDDDTASSSVARIFNGVFGFGGVANSGDDPHVAGSGAIGFARSGGPVVTTAGSEAGADHLMSDALSLRVLNSASGLQTTEGYDITLSLDSSGRIVGRVDDTDAGAMNGKAAFAVALDQDGEVFVAQYLSLKHPDTANPDDTVNLDGKIAIRYAMTDTDYDTVTAQINIGAKVLFADDGPTLTAQQAISQSVYEANIDTKWSDGSGAGEGPAVVSGSVSGFVNFGADGKGSFGFTEDALTQLGTLNLASKQGESNRPLSFVLSGPVEGVMTITATETDIPFNLFNPASWGDSSNSVFQLDLNTSTGAYEFRLYDELVHANGDAGTVIGLDFGSMIQAVDGDGDMIELDGKLTINVQDDVPVLQGESHTISEDYAGVLSGNVLANDEVGADHLASFRWLNTKGTYGDFDGYGDGDYRYNLYQDNVQFLDDGESRQEKFSYEVKDSDGDVRTETVTITITGSNDQPTISVNTGEWSWSWRDGWRMENDEVDEEAMASGSNPTSNAEFAYGTFTVADPDGLDDLQYVTINGNKIAIADLETSTVKGSNGTLTVTDYNDKTGVATYKYELTKAAYDGKGTETDTFTLTTSDDKATSGPATITIEINDDGPNARSDTNSVEEGATLTVAALNGVLKNDTLGADGATVSQVVGYKGATDNSFDVNGNLEVKGQYGTLTIKADGSYQYKTTANSITGNVTDTFTYTLRDGDGDEDTATLKISVTDSKLVALNDDAVKVYENALDTVLDTGDLKVSAVTGSLGTTSAGETGGDSLSSTDGFGTKTYTLEGSADGKYGTIQVNGDGTYTYTLTKPVDNQPHANDGTETALNVETFTYKVTDANGNWSTAKIYIDIVDDVPTAKVDEDVVEFGKTITGNVLDNDTVGADKPGNLFSFNGKEFGSNSELVFKTANGTLTVEKDGDYTYVSSATGTVDATATTLVGWQAKVGLYGFTDGTWLSGGKLVTAELDAAAANLVAWKGGEGSGKDGIGVGSTGNKSLGDGEHLVVNLGSAGTTSATVGIGQFNAGQGDPSSAGWQAFDSAGNLVASGDFGSAISNGDLYTMTIETGTEFQYLVFDWGEKNDGYVLAELKYGGSPESLTDTFSYVMQDSDGDQSKATLTITQEGSDEPTLKLTAWNDSKHTGEFETGQDNLAATFTITQETINNTTKAGDWTKVLLSESKVLDPAVVTAHAPQEVQLQVTSDVKFTFLSEGAGYQNTVGWYDLNDPTVGHIVWSNASAKDSGGTLKNGDTITIDDVPAGTRLGFFLIPDAYSPEEGSNSESNANLLSAGSTVYFQGGMAYATFDSKTGQYSGLINSTDNGMSGDADPVWFSNSVNVDKLQHAVTGTQGGEPSSTLYVGFEDLANGGDKDYNDVVFKVDLGAGNEIRTNPVTFNLGVDIPDGTPELKSASIDFKLGDGDTIRWNTDLAEANGLTVTKVDTGYSITADDGKATALQIEDLLDTFQIQVGFTGTGENYNKVDSDQRSATVSVTDLLGNESNDVTAVFNLLINDTTKSHTG